MGAGLARDGHFILDAVPFPITPARLEFARTCLPLCRRWFPAALEELRGLAQGQGCAPDELAGVLFSMYAMPPGPCCSCFALRRGRGALFGRNSDFLTELEEHNANCLYRFSDGGYSFVGNTTSFLQMEDGVNQFGLAAGLTSVPPSPPRPGLNAGLTLRLLLESCRDVPQALALLRQLPVSSCHTLVLADRAGRIALAECAPKRTPRYPLSRGDGRLRLLRQFLPPLRHGPLPRRQTDDDWRGRRERHPTLTRSLAAWGPELDLQAGQDLLSGRMGFLCQYDRREGRDTVWSVLYDTASGTLLRAEGNPGRLPFQPDSRLSVAFPDLIRGAALCRSPSSYYACHLAKYYYFFARFT